ncbi:MAG: hypothetical protein ACSHX6_07825 [Akkermansiaceae bacterium]
MKANLIICGMLLVSLYLLGNLFLNSFTNFAQPVNAKALQNWYSGMIISHVGPVLVILGMLLIAFVLRVLSNKGDNE